jgi:hypothetical protein
MFGMDKEFMDDWFNGHGYTYLTARNEGIKALVWYQRKSRDATTLLGNTLFSIIAVVAVVPDWYQIKASMFIGDDVLLFTRTTGKQRASDTMDVATILVKYASLFNLEA